MRVYKKMFPPFQPQNLLAFDIDSKPVPSLLIQNVKQITYKLNNSTKHTSQTHQPCMVTLSCNVFLKCFSVA